MNGTSHIIFVLGLPGVGKTTLLKEAGKYLDSTRYCIRNFGDIMMEIGRKRGVLEEGDIIRKIPEKLHNELQHEAAIFLTHIAEKKNVIVDSHSVIETSYGYMPGLPLAIIKEVNPYLLIHIEASSEEILGRRKRDCHERNIKIKLSDLELHQQTSRQYAVTYSILSDAFLRILSNPEHKIAEVSQKLLEFLQFDKFRCF